MDGAGRTCSSSVGIFSVVVYTSVEPEDSGSVRYSDGGKAICVTSIQTSCQPSFAIINNQRAWFARDVTVLDAMSPHPSFIEPSLALGAPRVESFPSTGVACRTPGVPFHASQSMVEGQKLFEQTCLFAKRNERK